MNQVTAMLLAAGVGALLPIQVAMNMQLRAPLRDPLLTALPNFLVGTAVIAGYVLLMRVRLPSASALVHVPVWAWFGGLIGAAYVVGSLHLGPKIGATLLLALLLTGQMAMSLLVDHFGLLGFPRHPVNLARLAGVMLLVAGALMIVKN
ncbi:MAG: DMT family transporter [Betaproteobacteria bacterium]|nr:DMT family transporter [Betaproteobacteria bacterium]